MTWIKVKNVAPDCLPRCSQRPSVSRVAVGSIWQCDECKQQWEVTRPQPDWFKQWTRVNEVTA